MKKVVSFNEQLNEYYFVDNDKLSRKGPWEEYARDTARFRKKIKEKYEMPLAKILDIHHREKIYEKINMKSTLL